MLDPAADPARKIWIHCVLCQQSPGWCYMLGYEVGMIWAQCPRPECEHRFWHDSGFGVGRRVNSWWDTATTGERWDI